MMKLEDMMKNINPQNLNAVMQQLGKNLSPQQISQLQQTIKNTDPNMLKQKISHLSASELQREISQNPALAKELSQRPEVMAKLNQILNQ